MKKTTTVSETPVATPEKSRSVKATKKTTAKPVVAKEAQEAPASSGGTKTKSKVAVAHDAQKITGDVPISTDIFEKTPEAPVADQAAKAAPKKTSPKPKAPKVAPVVEPESNATPVVISMHERIGLTAGVIWHHLAENGATPVAKLVYVLPEDEAIIQRSIGWLAQEDKITLSARGGDQVETIVLKG